MSKRKKYRDRLMDIAKKIAFYSSGRARLAFAEKNESKAPFRANGHFIKVDGKRVGQDIELFGCEAGNVNWELIFLKFFEDILLPIRKLGLEDSYNIAAGNLKILGHEVFKPADILEWDELFN
jgi:hypothetical protein